MGSFFQREEARMKMADGSLISFDTSKIKIRELVLEYFGEGSIQEIIEKNENNLIYKNLYELQKTSKFAGFFSALVNDLSNKLEEKNFFYQTIPSFRIHRVQNKSVNYHNDVMYGHGEKVINIWLPFNDTNKDNSLYISDIETSKNLLAEIRANKLSIIQTNELLRVYCAPQFVRYGQMLLFNTMTVHGTEVNNSTEHRLSFDFRLLPHGESSGVKDISVFYTNNMISKNQKSKIKNKKCLYYLVQGDSLGINHSHSLQRQVLQSFANNNNFDSQGHEETEICGMSHYPNLFHHISYEKVENILMFSILSLPKDYEMRSKVLTEAIKNKVRLFFCIEKSDNQQLSIEQINEYYTQVEEARNTLGVSK